MSLHLLAYIALKISTPNAYHPSLASVLVNASNAYFNEHDRLIFDLTSGNNWDFSTGLLQGHNTPVKIFKPPLKGLNNLKGDRIIVLDDELELDQWGWNSAGRVLVIARGDDQLALNITQEIWRVTHTRNVVTAMIDENGTAIDFYSWIPYQLHQCGDVKSVELVDKWRNASGFQRNAVLYQHVIFKNSMNKCPIVATAFAGAPYASNDFKTGIDIELIQILSRHFNFTLIIKPVPQSENFFLPKTRNGDYHGALKRLHNHEADLAIPAMTAQVDRFSASQPLYPHMMERIVWSVPSPTNISPVSNIFRVFTATLWILIVSTVISLTLLVYASHRVSASKSRGSKEKPRGLCSASLYTFAATITGQTMYRVFSWNLRLSTTLIFLLSMHFMIAYQSSLIYLLTVPTMEEPYENLEQLEKAGLFCWTYAPGLHLLRQARKMDKKIPSKCSSVDDMWTSVIEDIAHLRDKYLLFPETIAYYSTSNQYEDINGRDLIMQLPEPFLVLPLSFLMSPENLLAEPFSVKMQQMAENGIMGFWYVRIKYMHVTKKVFSESYKDETDIEKHAVLSIAHLQGAFVLHGAILIFTVLVFIVEILVKRYNTRKSQRKVSILSIGR